MASGHVNRIKRPDTWLHRPMLQNVKKVLANPEPSTHGTNRTSRAGRCRPEVAVEGKTGAIDSTRNFNSYLDRRRFLSPLTLPALQGTALPQAWKRENLP